jgi:hypothetical protein
MKLLKKYFDVQKELFDYFGYKEDWKVIPLDDQLGRYWMICGPEDENTTAVAYSDKPFTPELIKAGAELYGGNIYTQRFLPKWVYRGKEYTMVAVDTHTDGNKFLMVFENEKECKDDAMKKLYHEHWNLWK